MLLQSLLRPVLTPIMRGIFDPAQSVSAAWTPLALWPDGIATPGMWISPRDLTSEWQDYTGTTPVVVPGTVADTSNPVGLALDIRAGATVLTDPGNHMLQSTSAARPLASARVNLLTYTEDLSTGWANGNTGISTGVTDPDGGTTAITLTALNNTSQLFQTFSPAFTSATGSLWVRRRTGTGNITLYLTTLFNITSEITSAWSRIERSDSNVAILNIVIANMGDAIDIWHPQLQIGTTATDYQSVPGDGSTYATDFPIAQLYDGVDDGMATAAFTAGTLINGMDCMIPVRRDAGTVGIVGLSDVASAGYFFGFFHEPNNIEPNFGAVGTPTTWCDGVQLAGGTATTRATLYNALTAGDWHIVEWRGLDLSGFTAAVFSAMTSGTYRLNGARGDIMLYPSTDPTEDKDAARQWLADYYGVTLP